jgi:spermidine/putrescine transport system permease protein
MRRGPGFSLAMFVLTMAFFYLPLGLLVAFSCNASRTMHWGGFSLHWYHELFFNSSTLWHSFGNSAIIATTSASLATAIGTLGAIGIYWYKFRFKKVIQVATFLPLIMPEIIMGVSLLIFFEKVGIKLSLMTVFLAHVTFNIPFVLLIVMARLEEFDYAIIEAAHDLGAGEFDVLRRVVIPMSLPGIIAGFLMAITLSLEDFVITFFVAGPGASTLPLHIYSMIRFGVSPVINALSVIIIAGTFVLAFSTQRFYKYLLEK